MIFRFEARIAAKFALRKGCQKGKSNFEARKWSKKIVMVHNLSNFHLFRFLIFEHFLAHSPTSPTNPGRKNLILGKDRKTGAQIADQSGNLS